VDAAALIPAISQEFASHPVAVGRVWVNMHTNACVECIDATAILFIVFELRDFPDVHDPLFSYPVFLKMGNRWHT
jgi:hypothetical protein